MTSHYESFNEFISESFGDIVKSFRKESRSIRNRIQSILSDSKFVQQVSEAYGLPLVANERCGRWYIPTDQLTDSVYFKSTDGHTGQWAFSLRRLNVHLFDVINQYNGYVKNILTNFLSFVGIITNLLNHFRRCMKEL